MDDGIEEVAAFAKNKSRWEIWAIGAMMGSELSFAIWAEIGVLRN